jgi:hypothetical protein
MRVDEMGSGVWTWSKTFSRSVWQYHLNCFALCSRKNREKKSWRKKQHLIFLVNSPHWCRWISYLYRRYMSWYSMYPESFNHKQQESVGRTAMLVFHNSWKVTVLCWNQMLIVQNNFWQHFSYEYEYTQHIT